ncbi:hypothetical protein [Legionella drancourtii]|jgi:hypothetical protein|uniref:Uncharacterized protein n=1 Tax=Legionella drancourtii LLAP12 TaxID=658187 RepID=G9EQA8_9GAMM|nr:hypothetical protein [Legionella drancourtii]EHL30503.1 hypothetical protein LDG_7455 [Legionella drancourtii LLAP12]
MLKKFLKPTIIVVVQLILLLILIAVISPLLLKNANSLNQLGQLIRSFKGYFLFMHGLFYASLYFLWPYLVQTILRKQVVLPTEAQLAQALKGRIYLVGILVLLELLNLLR